MQTNQNSNTLESFKAYHCHLNLENDVNEKYTRFQQLRNRIQNYYRPTALLTMHIKIVYFDH